MNATRRIREMVAVLLLLISSIAVADEQSRIDAAKRLLELMDADQSIEQAYEQVYSQMSLMADQLGVTEEQRPVFDHYMEKMVVVMKEEMNWQKLEPQIIDVYVSVYTEEELNELNEFYASRLGQKFIAKTPELMQATMEMTQRMIGEMVPRLAEIQQEMYAELEESKEAAE